MSEYIYEKDASKDEQLIKDIRQKINNWGNNIPHHDFQNLGDKIEVLSLWYKPSYPIRFSSQFESRFKGEDYQPYNGDSIPTRKYYSLDDLKSWDITLLPEVEQFAENESICYVQGSQYVENCHTCYGHGVVTCPKCKGHKKIKCPRCKGRGKNNCHNCGGAGENTCSSCGGSGSKYQECAKEEVGYIDTDGRAHYRTCSKCKGIGGVYQLRFMLRTRKDNL